LECIKNTLVKIPIEQKTVLYHSVESGNIKVANMLLSQRHINPNLNPMYLPLFLAVSHQMTDMVRSLLSTKATDPNKKDSNGRLALTLRTSWTIIKLLIGAGAELDIRDSTCLTAQEKIYEAGINPELLMRANKRRRVK
jgi:ankyrin repeat protein